MYSQLEHNSRELYNSFFHNSNFSCICDIISCKEQNKQQVHYIQHGAGQNKQQAHCNYSIGCVKTNSRPAIYGIGQVKTDSRPAIYGIGQVKTNSRPTATVSVRFL